tara:strand:- start:19 stop:360 length:342 start_codon:yes stop_codon:yes gene_type:complete
MYSISYERHSKEGPIISLKLAIEATINKYKNRGLSRKSDSSQVDSPTCRISRYEVGNLGVIEYREITTLKVYSAEIQLQGFKEKGKKFRRIKKDFKGLKGKTDEELRKLTDLV